VINNHDGNSARYTVDLVFIDVTGEARVVDLKPAVERALGEFLQKRDARDHARYQWRCAFDKLTKDSRKPAIEFDESTLPLPFEADIPNELRNVDAGLVTFSLPSGSALRVVADEPVRRALLHP
jgi:hypothetical protein